MIKRLFVGGSGRSGTTLMLEALGKHPQIYSLPMEMRFIIDPDGLINLVNIINRDFCPFQAREAIYRFHKLMTHHLCRPRQRPYLNFDFPRIFGKDFYYQRCQQFFQQITNHQFQGRSYFEGNEENLENTRQIFGARYFSNPEELLQICASFVDDLFSTSASQAGKPIWCEKTPFNVLHIDFLSQLFPDAPVIHIIRDPRAVILSLIQPSEYWAPSNVHDAALFLDTFFQRWFQLKEKIHPNNPNLIEIKYEELVENPLPLLQKLQQKLQLELPFQNIPPMNIERLHAWKKDLTPTQIHTIEEVLHPLIQKLGYK